MIFGDGRQCLIVSLLWANIAGLGYSQLDRKTHLAPPQAALNGDNIDEWDEVKCSVIILTSDMRARSFGYKLSRRRLGNTPDWEEDQLVPRIPPGFALRLAKHKYDSIQPFGDVKYRTELQLQQYWGKWLWSVVFTPVDIPVRTADFPVFVLMDGAVLEPEERLVKIRPVRRNGEAKN